MSERTDKERDRQATDYAKNLESEVVPTVEMAFQDGWDAALSSLHESTQGSFTPEYDSGWLDGYNRAKDEDQTERDALIEAAQDHRKAASIALNRVYELEAIERAHPSQPLTVEQENVMRSRGYEPWQVAQFLADGETFEWREQSGDGIADALREENK